MTARQHNWMQGNAQRLSWPVLVIVFVAVTVVAMAVLVRSAFAVEYRIPGIVGAYSDEAVVSEPVNVRVTESGSSSVEVAWDSTVRSIFSTDPYGAESYGATTYSVKIFANASGELVDAVETTETVVLFTGLKKNTGFTVTVRAAQSGAQSEAVEVRARTVPAAPVNLTASVAVRRVHYDVITNKPVNGFDNALVGTFSAALKWRTPKGKIRYYTVEVFKKKDTSTPIASVKSSTMKATVTGLSKGSYAYRVTAHFNDEYSSETSRLMNFKAN